MSHQVVQVALEVINGVLVCLLAGSHYRLVLEVVDLRRRVAATPPSPASPTLPPMENQQ